MNLRHLLVAALVICANAPAKAEEFHLSPFGQVMPSVPWIIALKRDIVP